MNTNPEVNCPVPEQAAPAAPDAEFHAVRDFFAKRGLSCLPVDDNAGCVALYLEKPVAEYVYTALPRGRGYLETRATPAWFMPVETQPVMARFIEMINERLPKGRLELDPQTGNLWMVCRTERANPDVPLEPQVVEEHLAYTCRMFFLLWALIQGVNQGHADAEGIAEAIKVTWPALEPLVPHLAEKHFPEEALEAAYRHYPRMPHPLR